MTRNSVLIPFDVSRLHTNENQTKLLLFQRERVVFEELWICNVFHNLPGLHYEGGENRKDQGKSNSISVPILIFIKVNETFTLYNLKKIY